MIIEFNNLGHFIRQPLVGSITGTIKVSVEWDDAWTGKENYLRLINGKVVFDLNADYAINRLNEYPAIGDQLDALFKAGVFPEDMAASIQAVKDKYPKGQV